MDTKFEIAVERTAASLEKMGIAAAKHTGDAFWIIRALEGLLERAKNQNLAKATQQIEESIKKVNEALSKLK